jgi:hypothetical protein
MSARRFPAPWSVEELTTGFVVREHNGEVPLCYTFPEGPKVGDDHAQSYSGYGNRVRVSRTLHRACWREESEQTDRNRQLVVDRHQREHTPQHAGY